jgi:DeoR/GlpR family transcriptional regulator of sugar metabolism
MLYERSLTIGRRLNTLLSLIQTGRYSTPALAEELGVSVPTVSRDIAALRQRSYAIRSTRKSHGWSSELTVEPSSISTREEARVP